MGDIWVNHHDVLTCIDELAHDSAGHTLEAEHDDMATSRDRWVGFHGPIIEQSCFGGITWLNAKSNCVGVRDRARGGLRGRSRHRKSHSRRNNFGNRGCLLRCSMVEVGRPDARGFEPWSICCCVCGIAPTGQTHRFLAFGNPCCMRDGRECVSDDQATIWARRDFLNNFLLYFRHCC